jgi:glutathione S-transferase
VRNESRGERKEETKRKRVEKGNNPNNKIPAIVYPNVEGEPVLIMKSGAILIYFGTRVGKGSRKRSGKGVRTKGKK